VIETLTRAIVWAEFDVLESLSRGFRPENKSLSMGHLLLVGACVAAVTVLVWALSRYIGQFDPRRRVSSPRALFAQLCQAHSLAWPERQLLRRLAREQELDMPAMLFIEPERFEPSRWSRAMRARGRELEQIRRRLFGKITPADSAAS
jgi:hypothetical protein